MEARSETAGDSFGLGALGDAASQRVGAFTALPALIRELGADPVAIQRETGLLPEAFDRAENKVSYRALARLIGETGRATGCEHFGILAGRMWRLADFGVVGELCRHSASMGEALQTFCAHQYLNSGGGLSFLLSRGTTVEFGYTVYHPAIGSTRQVYACAVAMGFTLLRELGGPGWQPTEVLLPYAAPPDTSPYFNFFKAPVRFNAEVCVVRFSSRWMQHPVEGADRIRYQCALRLAEAAGDVELLQGVVRALRLELLRGHTAGDGVARALAMHRRTLNRRLKARGLTFQQVLDGVRLEVARQLLRDSEVSLDDVAAALGYAGVSPFMRSFRRWTGTTPARWRRAASGTQDAQFTAPSVRHATPVTAALSAG